MKKHHFWFLILYYINWSLTKYWVINCKVISLKHLKKAFTIYEINIFYKFMLKWILCTKTNDLNFLEMKTKGKYLQWLKLKLNSYIL